MDLTSEEKGYILEELAKKRNVCDIARFLGRGRATIYRFIKNSGSRKTRRDRGTVKSVSKKKMLEVKRQVRKKHIRQAETSLRELVVQTFQDQQDAVF